MFTRAIVRRPGKSMVNGISSAGLGQPDYNLALKQHDAYIETLESCGLEVDILEADENFPDSTFVEDVALLTEKCAIITNPGAETRKGETSSIEEVLKKYYSSVEVIEEPGTVEAGDIMMVGDHFYIGISARTNVVGARHVISHLEKNGMTGSMVNLQSVLHLKTGISYIENNNMVAYGEFISKYEFSQYNMISVDEKESYAANCIWVNEKVIVPKGFHQTTSKIEAAGYRTIELDMSEFRKLDGGLSCLSLRF